MAERTCTAEGCDRPHKGHGYCSLHWQRWKKTGTVDPPAPVVNQRTLTCTVPQCTRPISARGWCHAHYRRWKLTGDIRASEPVRDQRETCSIEGCNRRHRNSGLCNLHRVRLRTHGTAQPQCPPIESLDGEEWLDVPEYEGLYEVSNWGRVKTLARDGQICDALLSQASMPKFGHKTVCLYREKGYKTYLVHRLVMLAFVGVCPEGMQVCHYDGRPSNNRLDNLRYDTQKANEQDKRRHGTYYRRARSTKTFRQEN